MDTRKVWGIIIIVVGVALFIMGGLGIIEIHEIESSMGSAYAQFGAAMPAQYQPSYTRPVIMLILGAGLAYFGTKMLQRAGNPLVSR